MTFSYTAPLIGTDADVKSANLNALFSEIELELGLLGGIGNLGFPDPASASQFQTIVLNADKTGFNYSYVVRGTADLSITGVGTNGQVIASNGVGGLTFTTLSESLYTAQASNFTGVTGNNYLVGSAVTQITLPNSPAAGNVFTIFPGNGTNMTSVSIIQAASGERINGSNATFILPADKCAYRLVCTNTGSSGDGWIVLAFPLGRQAVINNQICDFRLSLATGTPVTTTAQTAKTTIFCTPFKGNRIALYNATTSEWEIYATAEVSCAVPSTTVTPFDIIATANASTGVVTLTTINWTNDTTRATAISFQDGIPMIGSSRLLGTGRTTGVSGQTQITPAGGSCLLENLYNKVPIDLYCADATASWTYQVATWRAANASSTVGTGRVEFITGVVENAIQAVNLASSAMGAGGVDTGSIGIGLNATASNNAGIISGFNDGVNDTTTNTMQAMYTGYPTTGYNFVSRLEIGNATTSRTFFGTQDSMISGMYVRIWA